MAFTACLNCIDIKSRSAVNTQRGPQGCGERLGRGRGRSSGSRGVLAPKGANAPASWRRGGGAAPRRRCFLGLQPGSAPNSEEPTLLPLPQQGGVPSKPLGRPRSLAPRGIAAKRRGRRGESERVRARPPAAGGREVRRPPRQRRASSSAAALPRCGPLPAGPASALRKRLKERISVLRKEGQSLFTTRRAHPPRAPGGRKALGLLEERKTGRPGEAARGTRPGPAPSAVTRPGQELPPPPAAPRPPRVPRAPHAAARGGGGRGDAAKGAG